MCFQYSSVARQSIISGSVIVGYVLAGDRALCIASDGRVKACGYAGHNSTGTTSGSNKIKAALKNNRQQTIAAQDNRPQSQFPCGFPAILFTKSAPENIGRTQAPLPTIRAWR
jgi:hypothetical protein